MKVGNLEVYGVIYKIKNLANNKVYIGQTTRKRGFDGRYLKRELPICGVYEYHKKLKDRNMSFNNHLYSAIKKYGFESFEVNKIIDVAFSKRELDIKEIMYINLFNSTDSRFGYNKKEGGSNGRQNEETLIKMRGKNHHSFGRHLTDEVKQKIRDARLRQDNSGINNPNAKSIICLNNGKIYKTLTEAKDDLNVSMSGISSVITGRRPSIKGKIFMSLTKFYDLNVEDRKNLLDKYNDIFIKKDRGVRVFCIEDKIIFESIRSASNYYLGDHSVLSRALDKPNRTFKGKHFITYTNEFKEVM